MFANIINLLSLLTVSLAIRPEDLLPCTLETVSQIHCSGPEITDEVLKEVGKKIGVGEYHTLLIHSTDVTQIENNTFGQTIFDYIYIDNNHQLVTIGAQAFRHSPAIRELIVVNNPLLADITVFDLVVYLLPSETVGFIGNSFREIPENAFAVHTNASRLKHIHLSHNKIEKIGVNAFLGHSQLEQITLDHNRINQLDNNSFNLNYTHNSRHSGQVYVMLDSNNLTEKSFARKAFGDSPANSITIDLENNHISHLPEPVFSPLMEASQSALYLYGNSFVCDCTMRWILSESVNARIQGLYCANLNDSIHAFTAKQLGCSDI